MVIKSSRFSFNAASKLFVAEESDLGCPKGDGVVIPFKSIPIPKSFPLKHDFQMESVKTGAVLWFYHERAVRDNEGEITHWIYKPMPESVTKSPGLAGSEVHILND